MMYSINMIFYLLLTFSTMVVISSPSWFCMWMGVEMNTMAFIPILYQLNNKLPTESALKYFLSQTFASMIMFLGITMLIMKDFYMMLDMSNVMLLAMGIKLGVAPFHMWYPSVVEGLLWSQNMILMTWQKIAPLMIMFSIQPSIMNIIMVMFSSIIGPFGGFNQTSLRSIMAYSSITHMSWMIISMFNKSITWMIYMLIYFVTTVFTLFMFFTMKITHSMQISYIPLNYLFPLLVILLSMGGFPPLMGFSSKWLVLMELVKSDMVFIPMLLVLSSCMNLYIYLRIIHPLTHMNMYTMKLKLIYLPPYTIIMVMTLLSMLSTPIITLV